MADLARNGEHLLEDYFHLFGADLQQMDRAAFRDRLSAELQNYHKVASRLGFSPI